LTKGLSTHFVVYLDCFTEKREVKTMRLRNKWLSKSKREKTEKVEIERLEKQILELKGEKREERMKTYRKLLLSLADQVIYFMRS
jgi:hypothetical protein